MSECWSRVRRRAAGSDEGQILGDVLAPRGPVCVWWSQRVGGGGHGFSELRYWRLKSAQAHIVKTLIS